MTERQSGLRFDIYERIHLADETVGIKELDEVELVPHIQVYTEGEQAVLRGNLFVTGKYTGETGSDTRSLEHLIPVEITLPLNRIHDVNDVRVAIDNFDVDVLSSRSLNVTGVLTLEGIEMLSVADDSWREEEETVFVHEAKAPVQQESEVREQEDVFAGNQSLPVEQAPVAARQEGHSGDATSYYIQARTEDVPASVELEAAEAPVTAEPVHEAAEQTAVPVISEEAVPVIAEEAVLVEEQEALDLPAEAPAAEKQEIKIGFGSKPATDQEYSLKNVYRSGETRVAAVQTAEPEAEVPAAASDRENRLDALEWRRLFVRSTDDQASFSRIRMCIVQKEESIEAIADRYKVNPREILLYNRVSEQDLAEGKVLYIPGV